MIDTYDMQICDHCGCEFTHSYFSGGTRSCSTCKFAYSTAPEPHGLAADDLPDEDWLIEDTYSVGDIAELQVSI